MALSDHCLDFANAVLEAIDDLDFWARYYKAPEYTRVYGTELDALIYEISQIKKLSLNADRVATLLRLAIAIWAVQWSAPADPALPERQRTMDELIDQCLAERDSKAS